MRIYINNINFKMINYDKVVPYLVDHFCQSYIYSEEGIYRIDNNTLRKVNFIDGEIIKYDDYLENSGITLDYSIIKRVNTPIYHVPIKHITKKINIYHYCLRKGSPLFLVIVKNDVNEIVDIYFILNSKQYAKYSSADINNPLIKEDIQYLFNLLKCK